MEVIQAYLLKLIHGQQIKEALLFLARNVSEKSPLYKDTLLLASRYFQLNDSLRYDLIDKHFAKRENYHIHKRAISIITKLAELDLNEKIEITLKYDEEAFKNSQASNLEEWLTKRLLKKEPYQLVSEKEVV